MGLLMDCDAAERRAFQAVPLELYDDELVNRSAKPCIEPLVDGFDPKKLGVLGGVHPFANYLKADVENIEAPEFVVDDVIAAGTVVFAGERGLGKTSALVPLLICCTGLLDDYPLTSSIRRRVVYVAEDTRQVQRIFSAMRTAGILTATREEVNEWFKLVEAKRMSAPEIVKVLPYFDELYTDNKRVDGSIYCAPPCVVLDTTNASICLDNISDNSEVSDAVATLRQNFGVIPLILVGHVSKASRSDARQLSFIGAGSWEGDTQQSLYLVSDDGERYLVLGKRRFETDVTEYRIVSYARTFEAIDKLGSVVAIKCYYGVPEASDDAAKAEAKEQRQDAIKMATWDGTLTKVLQYVKQNPRASTRDISASVSGNAKAIRGALAELIEKGEIRVEDGPRNAKYHYADI